MKILKADEESTGIHPMHVGADVLMAASPGRTACRSVEVEEIAVQDKHVPGVRVYASIGREKEVEVVGTRTIQISGPDTVEVTWNSVPRLYLTPDQEAQTQ